MSKSTTSETEHVLATTGETHPVPANGHPRFDWSKLIEVETVEDTATSRGLLAGVWHFVGSKISRSRTEIMISQETGPATPAILNKTTLGDQSTPGISVTLAVGGYGLQQGNVHALEESGINLDAPKNKHGRGGISFASLGSFFAGRYAKEQTLTPTSDGQYSVRDSRVQIDGVALTSGLGVIMEGGSAVSIESPLGIQAASFEGGTSRTVKKKRLIFF